MKRLSLHDASGWRCWAYRRGLLYSPSNALIYERGTLFRPGQRIDYFPWLRTRKDDQ